MAESKGGDKVAPEKTGRLPLGCDWKANQNTPWVTDVSEKHLDKREIEREKERKRFLEQKRYFEKTNIPEGGLRLIDGIKNLFEGDWEFAALLTKNAGLPYLQENRIFELVLVNVRRDDVTKVKSFDGIFKEELKGQVEEREGSSYLPLKSCADLVKGTGFYLDSGFGVRFGEVYGKKRVGPPIIGETIVDPESHSYQEGVIVVRGYLNNAQLEINRNRQEKENAQQIVREAEDTIAKCLPHVVENPKPLF